MRHIITILAVLILAGGAHASSVADEPVSQQTSRLDKKKAGKNKRKKTHRIPVADATREGDDPENTMGDDVVEVRRSPVISNVEFDSAGTTCTPEALDSMLARLTENNTVSTFEKFFADFITMDSVPLSSDIPDEVYEGFFVAKLRKK